jgi:uncharacterized protein YdhG (YjbR/CyaY superfamily)
MDNTLNTKFKTVDEYISAAPENARKRLKEIREAVKEVVPGADEVISYNMPAFRFHGILLYFAAHAEHIGFYPGNSTLINVFKDELKDFETSKGTIRFPKDKSLPVNSIKKIVKIRANENMERSKAKSKKKKEL